jgi:hypothetical protein
VTCGIDLLGEQRHVVVAEELAIRKTLL